MTEKEYKLEQWTDNSLYYSFPNGNLHHSISNVLTRVEKDLNALHEENQRLQKKLDCITKSLQNELNQYGGFR